MKFFQDADEQRKKELTEEISSHLLMAARDREARGESPAEARVAAQRELGNAGIIQDVTRDQWAWTWLENLWQDLRYGARMLMKNPGLTLVIVLSLAIGIGANTAIFSVTSALLLKPLPYPHADRLALLWLRSPGIGIPQDWPSPGQYHDIKTQNHVFDDTAIAIGGSYTLTGLTKAMKVDGIEGSSSLLNMFGAKPLLGRTFLPEEDRPGKPDSIVLTYGLWQQAFGGDANILGRSVMINGKPRAVVGVLRADFTLNHEVIPTIGEIDKAEIFLPLPLDAKDEADYGPEDYNIVARLKPGVTMRQAQADIDVIAARLREEKHRDRSFRISVVPVMEQVVGSTRNSILILLGAVALVLLIACANVANLLLSRAAGRQKEIAVRRALGAGKGRLVMQLLTESILLSVLGGAAGLIIASWSLYLVHAIHPGNIPRMDEIGMDFRVLAFTLAVSIITGIVFGLAPAYRASRVDLNAALKAGGRSSRASGGLNVKRDKLRGALVIAELAVSLTLLAGAGLLIRSFARLVSVPPGFNTDHVISMQVSVRGPKYRQEAQIAQFYQNLSERVRNLPGVTAQGFVSSLPLTTAVGWGPLEIEGYVPPANQPELQVDKREATPDYFRTMQIPLISGRAFADSDTGKSGQVVLIDQKMAERFWPHGDAVGKRVRHNEHDTWKTIVGVVGVVKEYGLDTDTRMVVYFAHAQVTEMTMYLVARTTTDPASVSDAIIQQVHAVEPDAPVYDIATMQQRFHDSTARQRFATTMLAAFACFALILAAVGVYGVMSFLVAQGTPDIAIRMALGAQRRSILSLVFQQGMSLALIGIGAGLLGALILTRVMAGLLFDVSATDPLTFAGVAMLLTLVALAACYIPARRAMRVDPMVALRYE
jgi:putative ABC transport system permease protein